MGQSRTFYYKIARNMHFKNRWTSHHYVRLVCLRWISGRQFKNQYWTQKSYLHRGRHSSQSCRNGSFQSISDAYNPAEVEKKVHDLWYAHEKCQPESTFKQHSPETFSMLLPPPNVTGTLHLGHSLTVTIQDILARWHRMQGKRVLWIPGFDHAGIATQTTFEKMLWKERRQTRYDLGRDNFEKELWNWKREKHDTISTQLRSMGASLDWSRQYFTLDSKHSQTVTDVFIRLFSDGLIYRSESIINWCCELQSAISDIEVDYVKVEGPTLIHLPNYKEPVEFGFLTNFAYKSSVSDKELVVSTTRIETMLGDTAIAVHPNDERYTQWHGAQLWHPFRKTIIPVVCDGSVDPKFGTGAVKVTPAHSQIDYEIGKKHNLQCLSVINEAGLMNEICGKYEGLRRFDARKAIKDDLIQLGLFRDEKQHSMSVPICSRTGDVVEFLLKPQWYLACHEMSKLAIAAVEKGDLCISPSSYNKIWFSWLHNLRDWCISRQLWWGHHIPAYECSFGSNTLWIAAENAEKARDIAAQKMNLHKEEREKVIVTQDVDVLDTWFSSALLPFSSLGWPQQTDDMKQFYPLSMMETGHDILFFWVARMVMLGSYLTGKLPFKKVVLHGIICDSFGRKMSKSLGNVINPLDIIDGASVKKLTDDIHKNYDAGLINTKELDKSLHSTKIMFPNGIPECGTDALRFTLCSQNISNVSINFDVTTCQNNRQFCNKIWQACRYIESNYGKIFDSNKLIECAPKSNFDKWIISRLSYLVVQVNDALHREAFHSATIILQNFIHDELCSVYLEGTKPAVRACDSSSVRTMKTLALCMDVALRALSPFMPFLTEHLYQNLSFINKAASSETVTLAPYPCAQEWAPFRDTVVEDEMKNILALVSNIRHMKSVYNITKKEETHGYISCSSDKEIKQYQDNITMISALTGILNIDVIDHVSEQIKAEEVSMSFGDKTTVYLKTSKQRKDKSREIHEKVKKYKSVLKDLEKLQKITSHASYIATAPEAVQKKHMERIASLEAEISHLRRYGEILEEIK